MITDFDSLRRTGMVFALKKKERKNMNKSKTENSSQIDLDHDNMFFATLQPKTMITIMQYKFKL